MKKINQFLGFCTLLCLTFSTNAANVGVSVSVSQPGFYGRVDVGQNPAPVVIYPQPIIIEQRPVNVQRQPIYLQVPPQHSQHWAEHCHRYEACAQPVFFVNGQAHERGQRHHDKSNKHRQED
jgi:hypothetical protein